MKRGTCNQATTKMSKLVNEQYNSIFSNPVPAMTIKYPMDFFGHPQANTLQDINITRGDIIDAITTSSQNSSGGPDEFPAILLKQGRMCLSNTLAHLSNFSINLH